MTIVDIPRTELKTIFRDSSPANIITARLHGSVAFRGTGNKHIISLGLKGNLLYPYTKFAPSKVNLP